MIFGKIVLFYVFAGILVFFTKKTVSLSPVTFGGFVASAGQISNSIKVFIYVFVLINQVFIYAFKTCMNKCLLKICYLFI